MIDSGRFRAFDLRGSFALRSGPVGGQFGMPSRTILFTRAARFRHLPSGIVYLQ